MLELPQETSETAEAMRRVVSDQIRALKELAALVSEFGRRLRRRRAGGSRSIAPAAAAAPPRAIRSPCRATVEAPRRIESAPQREVAAARRRPSRSRRRSSSRSICRRRRPPRSRSPSGGGPARRGGARRLPSSRGAGVGPVAVRLAVESARRGVARGARAPPPPPPPETLEALTQSIAGLVDSAAAAETWDRWRRGDTAAVSRRLYTEAGQQAFEEIRRRYQTDPQFRETVTRYVQEFERLLAKVGQNDRDGSQWRAYLLSNTGKVYTILAHASGRLG